MSATAFDPQQRLTRKQAATFLSEQVGVPFTQAGLGSAAHRGDGPVFRKFGRASFYTTGDLLSWIEERTTAPMTCTRRPT